MKIIYLVANQGININMKGGAGTHIRGTIKGFQENGHHVLPLILGDENTNISSNINRTNTEIVKQIIIRFKQQLPKGVRLLLRDIGIYIASLKYYKKIIPKVKEFNPDFIYERSCILSDAGSRLSKKLKIPLFIETSGSLVEIFKEEYGLSSMAFANWLELKKMHNSRIVVTEAESAIEFVKSKYNIHNKTIISKPLGVNIKNLNQTKNKAKESPLEIGYIGTFASYHNVELLIPVFNYFKDKNVKFYLIGSGGNSEQIKSIVTSKNINNVIFTGYIENKELSEYLNIIDIGIVPDCAQQMLPIKTFEYGIYKICPMIPDYKEFDYIIKEGHNAITFKPKSPNDIILKIKLVLEKKIDIQTCSLNWQNIVIKNYQWKSVVTNVLKLAEKL